MTDTHGGRNDKLDRVVSMAKEHAADFATRAEHHDRTAEFPYENYKAMKESGYFVLAVPEELGGIGANIYEFCMAQYHLAQGCAATAMAVNMHLSLVGRRADGWRVNQDAGTEAFLRSVVEDGLLSSGINSDLKSGGDPRHTGAVAERVEGGYRLTTMYAFATNSTGADTISVMFNAPVESGELGMFSTSLHRDTEGLTIMNDWDGMGMRATGSNMIRFDNVFISDDQITRSRKPGIMTQATLDAHAWFAPSVTATCMGVAAAALDCAKTDTVGRKRFPYPRSMEHFPGQQFDIALAYIELESAKALLEKTTQDLSTKLEHTKDDYVAGEVCKYQCTRSAKKVVNDVMEMVGGAAYSRTKPYERYMRDVFSGTFFPQNKHTALELIGKHVLGVDWDTEPRFS